MKSGLGTGCILVCLSCYNKDTIDQVAPKQQKFISHRLEAGKSKVMSQQTEYW